MSTDNHERPRDDGASVARISTRNLADLARAGLEITRQPLTKVDFEVHHLAARPGYVRTLLPANMTSRTDSPADATPGPDNSDGQPRTAFLETLISSANGVDMVIGTRTREADQNISVPTARGGQPNPVQPEKVEGGWVFRQTAWPNPTFIYESARTYEGLIAVDPTRSVMLNWHAAAIRDLVEEVSRAAATITKAPLLTLQSPAQLPPTKHGGNHITSRTEGHPTVPSSIAVRFAIALHASSAEQFFALSDQIRALCEENHFGLWLKDTRPGYRSGNWFEICKTGRDAGLDYRRDAQRGDPITACLPVTCVGPARVGSTHAIASFLRRYAQVGVVSCSGTTLDDLGLVHLQLSIQDVDAERLNEVVTDMADTAVVSSNPQTYLAELFRRLGLRTGPNGEDKFAGRASDYQTFVGPAIDYVPSDPADQFALWISWQVGRKHDGLSGPLECLYRALDQVVPDIGTGPNIAASGIKSTPLSTVANIEYMICRATEQPVIRVKGKLSVPRLILQLFEDASIEAPASRLCDTLEQAWKVQVDLAKVTGLAELTVAWRESWLGHWTFD